MPRVPHTYLYICCITLLWPVSTQALQCTVDPLAVFTELGGDPEDREVHVRADNSEGDYRLADFAGSVEMQQGDKHLFAPQLTYKHEEGKAELEQGGILSSPQAAIEGIKGHYDSDAQTATFEEAEYYMRGKQQAAVGSAKNARFDRKNNRDNFNDVTWTTCSRNKPAWHLQARSLTLDHNQERGIARDMTMRIGNVPVFYLPYFSFPTTSARQSGFLIPSLGSSEARGLEISVPYYWNIAPNQDATFTVRPMSKRGLMLESEYRFLGEKQEGTLYGSIIPHDRRASQHTRWSWRATHQYHFNDQWRTDFRYQTVSDVDYTEDFTTDFDLYNDWYLERHATLYGNSDYGDVMLRAQNYQRIDNDVSEADKPYSRLPQLTYNKTFKQGNWRYDFNAEAVHFHKENLESANRFSGDASVSYRAEAPYGYIEPQLSANIAHYDFSSRKERFADKHVSRFLPTFSLDNKLTLERNFSWQGEGWTQTLEPRLFYLYTPYKDQSNIPDFDTDERSLSWNWLFTRNRFVGEDRIGDANQLTTSLSSGFYRDSDGQEKLRLSLGQIQYFRDRRVTLGDRVDKRGKSVLVSEALYNIDNHWQLHGLSFWDTKLNRAERGVVSLGYHLDSDRFVNLNHHYSRNDYDQYSLASVWRLNPQWRFFYRQDYSAKHHRMFNNILGVEYNDCCWAWRLAGKHYRDNPSDEKKHNAIYLEFVLKGLGNMGSRSGRMLKEEIHGFTPLAEENEF
ncbi:MAG: LPS-assembly protein LptD [Cardiobacteriaceae bacterium]|nr:LPS-assembly protein LptD [Cardiobacteriaceae bacterium]